MVFRLGPSAARGDYRLLFFETIGSTNSEALARARQGDPGRLWLAALEQTEGRGRRGRRWETPAGNLAASHVAILDHGSAPHAATLGFVAGLSLHAALTELAPGAAIHAAIDGASGSSGRSVARFALKWPNDLLAGGAKLAGILLESERLPDGRLAVAVGIGVNVASAPSGLPYPATCLAELGCEIPPGVLFAELAERWAEYERIWAGGAGLGTIRDLWLSRAAGLGGPVVVRIGEGVLRGSFETIDEAGRLILRTADGSARAIAAAEVHFGAVASAPTGEAHAL